MRRRYRQDPKTLELHEIGVDESQPRVYVRGDLDDFISPVDRTVVHGRRSLREHNTRHNVVNYEEFGDSFFEKKYREREAYRTGQDSKVRAEWRDAYINAVKEKNGGRLE